MPRTVTVFGASGGSGARPGTPSYQEAYELGRRLAQAGFALCNGGYSGTMEAAARGASEAGGRTTGITVAQFDPAPPNLYLTEERKAPDLFERLRQLITRADACVCLRGGVGTLAEFALTWTLLQTHAVPPRPVVCVGAAWRALLDALRRHTLLREKDFRLLTVVDTVEEAVDDLVARLG